MSDLIPCKHLNHDPEKFPRLKFRCVGGVKYFYRPGEDKNKFVQFCRKNGMRINSIYDCYQPEFMGCHEVDDE